MHVCQSGVYESLSGSGKIDQFLLNPETNVIEASNQLFSGSGFLAFIRQKLFQATHTVHTLIETVRSLLEETMCPF